MRAARLLAALVIALSTLACAQTYDGKPGAYTPTPFQVGKDVVWVPTPQSLVDKLLDLAKVTKDDFVMDLGSGDGRLVITAARRGARAVGVEYNEDLVDLSKRAAEKEGVAERAVFVKADLFETDFSRATVVTMFLLPELNMRLRPKVLALKPGTRVVSNTFTMGDWLPDETVKLTSADGCSSTYCTGLFWVVPARVAGIHRLPGGGELVLLQEYQRLSGSLTLDGRKSTLEGNVRGLDVTFKSGGKDYRGKWNGGALELR